MNEFQPYIMIAIGLVSSGVVAWVWKTLRKLVRIAQNLHELLTPNGGSSIADKVNALIEVSDSTIEEQAKAAIWREDVNIRLKTVEIALIEMRQSDERVRKELVSRRGGDE